jgi:aminoglycoside phosphotransferase (APT) family kinase protein
VRFVLDRVSHNELAVGLAAVEDRILPLLDDGDPRICHGDFHPLNVLVDDDRTSVVDWTDAGIGDRHADIARTAWLFRLASVAAPRPSERAVLRSIAPVLARRYLASYRFHRSFDPDRLRLWMPLHLLHAWAMAIADESELVGPSRAGREFRPGLSAWARAQFTSSIEALP